MKTPTSNLHRLIHSMSAAEKRYFKRHYSSTTNRTTELFDIVNSISEYDEEYVKKRFGNDKSARNLKVYKIVLSDLLLKSLTSYHHKKSGASKIRIGLEEIEILMNKQLFDIAQDKLKKIKQFCIDCEESELFPAVLWMEIKLNHFYNTNAFKVAHFKEIETSFQRLNHLSRLQSISVHLESKRRNQLTQKITKSEKELYTKVLTADLANTDPKNLTTLEHCYLLKAMGNIHGIVHDDETKEFELKQQGINLLSQQNKITQVHYNHYWAMIYDWLCVCERAGNTEEFVKRLAIIKKLMKKHPQLNRNKLLIDTIEVKYLYQTQQFKAIIQMVEPLISQQTKSNSNDNYMVLSVLYLFASLAYLSQQQTVKAHYLIKKLQWMANHMEQGYSKFFDFFELINHYETNDIDVIKYLIATHKRKLKKQENPSLFFKEVLNIFSKLILVNPLPKAELVKNFKQQIAGEEYDDEVHAIAKAYILDLWLQTLEKDQPLSQTLQQNTENGDVHEKIH